MQITINHQTSVEAMAIVMGIFLSGLLMSLSLTTMPILVQTATSSSHVLQQWKLVFDRGHIQGPVLAILTLLANCYAAWSRASAGEDWKPFAVAGALTIGIVPYTWIFMDNINAALFAAKIMADQDKEVTDKDEAGRMINQWTMLHAGRSVLPLAGAITGFSSLLKVISF